MKESQTYDKKSLRAVSGKTADFEEIAKDCVAFANREGGHLVIGIEDDDELPLAAQHISEELKESVVKRINELTIVFSRRQAQIQSHYSNRQSSRREYNCGNTPDSTPSRR